MADDLVDKRITQEVANMFQAPLELDLIAYYKVVEEAMIRAAEADVESAEEYIDNVIALLGD